jgi:hypothetical protein
MAIFSIAGVTWQIVGISASVFIIAIVIGINYASTLKKEKSPEEKRQERTRIWHWLVYLLSILLLVAIGLGVPALIVYFFGGGRQLVAEGEVGHLAILGRGLQLIYIAIASTLPGLMYFMFRRQRLEKLRDTFIREAMMLDPNVKTSMEAKTKYGSLLESIYGSAASFSNSIPLFFSTALITLGWILTLLPIGQDLTLESSNLVRLFTPHAAALNYGFLGAYFFALNLVFRGYVRADLTAKTYTHVSIRFLVTTTLVWAVSSLPGLLRGEGGGDSPVILSLAFIIGVYPDWGMTLLLDFVKKAFGIINKMEDEHPLTNLEGINLYDRARLLEEGIENIQNLAYHNLMELIVHTRISTPRLVDLFDQAVLYLHLGLEPANLQVTRQALREYGIRTATDLQEVCKHNDLPDLQKPELPDLIDRLKVINRTLSDDDWMTYLWHWRRSAAGVEPLLDSPKNFYESAAAERSEPGERIEAVR